MEREATRGRGAESRARSGNEPLWLLALTISVVTAASCGGSDGGGEGDEGDPCASRDDCLPGLVCLDDVCTAVEGDGDADADGDADTDTDTDADSDGDADGDECPSGVLCGSPATCCEADQQCYEGTCVAACASGTRCGDDGLTCCGDSEVCLDTVCVEPGEGCADSFDCPEGSFCEPTLGSCLPQPTGPPCEVRPEFEDFEPIVEWEWTASSEDPAVRNVAVTPAVADIDADGVPEVVFGAYAAGTSVEAVQLVVLDGEDGSEELLLPLSTVSLVSWSGAALGQLDDDAELEMVVATTNLGLALLEHDGTVAWSEDGGSLASLRDSSPRTYPSLANMDDDPEPEIVVGGVVVDPDGTVLHDIGWVGCQTGWCVSAVADIDEDGAPDIVAGNAVYGMDGATLWTAAGVPDGFPAVADLSADGFGDVINVSEGNVYVLDGTSGSVLFGPVAIPGGGRGGPPTVADFDGDGRPEFAAAGEGRYAVYDLDCTDTGEAGFCPSGRTDGILWDVVTQDISSSITGSSVFDFEGDGAAEVVYNDECHLYVLDGATGETLLFEVNTSRTAMEYPLVVDVDGDGNSEFVVPSNNDQISRDGCDPPGTTGVRVFGDSYDRWVRTRPVWNQHTYHVTNVGPTGVVPATEALSWEVTGLNNFRQNVQGEGVFNAPNLVVTGVEADLSACPSGLRIRAQVANLGSLGVPAGVPVAFYLGDATTGALLGVVETTRDLLPGASESLSIVYEPPEGDEGPFDFTVVVDANEEGLGVVGECLEDDNDGSISDVACPIIG